MFDLDLCGQGSVFGAGCCCEGICYAAALLHPSALPKKNKSMNKTDKKNNKKKPLQDTSDFFPLFTPINKCSGLEVSVKTDSLLDLTQVW